MTLPVSLQCRIAAARLLAETGKAPSISAIQRAMNLKWKTQAERAIAEAIRAGYLKRGRKGLELMDGAQSSFGH